jgi:hypothetical protein
LAVSGVISTVMLSWWEGRFMVAINTSGWSSADVALETATRQGQLWPFESS